MTAIFVSYTSEDATCAQQIHADLVKGGYHVMQEPASSTQGAALSSEVEKMLLRSAAVIVIWSSAAAQSKQVEQQLLLAQKLKKLIIPIRLDSTALPGALATMSPIIDRNACTNALAHFIPILPAANSQDALIVLSEKMAAGVLRERLAAIEQATEMAKRGEQKEKVLVLLEHLVQHDPILGVSERAKAALDQLTASPTTNPSTAPSAISSNIFKVRCRNGHISQFDKHKLCNDKYTLVRGPDQKDTLLLQCTTCGYEFTVYVDC